MPIAVGPFSTTSPSAINRLFGAVRICAPGSTLNCKTISKILIDTGSVGLRIFASAIQAKSPTLLNALPGALYNDGNRIAECIMFQDDSADWGAVAIADVTLGQEPKLRKMPLQIIYPGSSLPAPASCNNGNVNKTPTDARYNGILGVGVQQVDCGDSCLGFNPNLNPQYYSCAPDGTCTGSTLAVDQQVPNPIAVLPADSHGVIDNQGVIVHLENILATGQSTATGSLTFGIGSRVNNQPHFDTFFNAGPVGNINASWNGHQYPDSILDTGANFLYFADFAGKIKTCGTKYCPPSPPGPPLGLCPKTSGFSDPNREAVPLLLLEDFYTLISKRGFYAFDDLGATNGEASEFLFGLPFFFGRDVYFGIGGKNAAPYGPNGFYAFDGPVTSELQLNVVDMPLAQALSSYAVLINNDRFTPKPNTCNEAQFQYDVSGGAPPYTFSASALPAGLTLNSSTGLISGTPELADAGNTYTTKICATDSCGQQACAAYGLIIQVGSPYGTYAVSGTFSNAIAAASVSGNVGFSAWPVPPGDICPGDSYSLGIYQLAGQVTVAETQLDPTMPILDFWGEYPCGGDTYVGFPFRFNCPLYGSGVPTPTTPCSLAYPGGADEMVFNPGDVGLVGTSVSAPFSLGCDTQNPANYITKLQVPATFTFVSP